MAKKPPQWREWFNDDESDAPRTDDEKIAMIAAIYASPVFLIPGHEMPPQGMGARLSFKDWDWMTRITQRAP